MTRKPPTYRKTQNMNFQEGKMQPIMMTMCSKGSSETHQEKGLQQEDLGVGIKLCSMVIDGLVVTLVIR